MKYKFTSTQIIEADSEQEAKDKFSETSFDFAANAECKKIKESQYEILEILSTKIESDLETEKEVRQQIQHEMSNELPFKRTILVKKLS